MCIGCYNFDVPISTVALSFDIFAKVRCSRPSLTLANNEAQDLTSIPTPINMEKFNLKTPQDVELNQVVVL
jgi:hypothetical protein